MVAQRQRQSPSGSRAWTMQDFANLVFGNQAANLVTENAQAVTAILPNDIPLVCGVIQGTGTPFISHARVTAAGTIALGFGVSAGVAEAATLDSATIAAMNAGIHRDSPSGMVSPEDSLVAAQLQVAFAAERTADHDTIGANGTVAATMSPDLQGIDTGDIVLVSPRAALPAGLALSHCQVNEDSARVILHNLTGVGIDPAVLTYDVVALRRVGPTGGFVRRSPNGFLTIRTTAVSVDSASIAAATVVETTVNVTLPGVAATVGSATNHPVAHFTPDAALPAGIAYSHARVVGPNQVAIGLANVTGGAINPAAIAGRLSIFTLPSFGG